jgi:spore maturation protein CgeB
MRHRRTSEGFGMTSGTTKRSAGLDIAFFGSSLVSAYWNGAATYYRGLLAALAGRGHRITFYEPDALDRQQHRDIDDPEWARVVVYPATGTVDVLAQVDDARGADLVVKASGVGVHDELLEQAVLALRGPRTLVAFWDVDAPATLERLDADPSDPFRELVPRYDLVLTYGGGPAVVEAYRRHGARLCVPIYNAHDPASHHPVDPDPRFAADLAFLGNRLPDREERVREFFTGTAARLPERRFLIGGNGWRQGEMPENVGVLGHVYTRDHNAFNSTPRAVLNVNRDSMVRFGHSPATRVFEAAGAGACLISDRWKGLDDFFAPGEEVLVADGGEEVAEVLAALTPERARRIGAAARRRALAEHTYVHRAAQVEAALDGVSAGRTGGFDLDQTVDERVFGRLPERVAS